MSEIRYCYHCHRSQPTIAQPSGFATCATCGTDELGEVVDPALTRTVSDEVPAVRYEATPPNPAPLTFADIAAEVAKLVEEKQAAYGDSFGRSGAVLDLLYPAGIPVEAYDDALAIVRVVDKLFRVATDRDALGESPWRDIAGYALLAVRRVEQDKGRA